MTPAALLITASTPPAAPLQSILGKLRIKHINWDNIVIDNEDLIVTPVPQQEYDNKSVHSFASATTVDIDEIIERDIP